MLTSGCVVMPREKGESEPPGFYSLNNNIGKSSNAAELNNPTPNLSNPRLRVRSNTTTSQPRSKPMLLQKHPSRTSQTHLDQILTNCNTRAMRYYRIWIYTCNAVLLISMLGFCAVAGKTILGDYRRHLIPSLALYQPSFLYAYLAIFTQSGVIQIVGCLGALRLSERLLNVYWLMLLVLLFGDIVIGIFWMFRLDKMIQELRPGLKFRLYSEYGQGGDWTVLWDRLQSETNCCGVQNAFDFTNIRGQNMIWTQAHSMNGDNATTIRILVPPSCCAMQEIVNENNSTSIKCQSVHQTGCEDRLRTYLRQTSETLFLIGYCVIAFVKVCFIGILRYEIREMIQKIKLLKAEMESRPSVASIDLGSNPNLGTMSPSHTVLLSTGTQNVNGSVRGAGIEGGTESERESLLVPDQETPAHKNRSAEDIQYHQKSALHRKLFPGDSSAATDSESHCALLVDESAIKTPPPNGNNNYEMRELQHPQQQVHNRQYRMSNPDTQTHNM